MKIEKFIEILKNEASNNNGVIFKTLLHSIGLNAHLVLNALVLKSNELNSNSFSYKKEDLIKDSILTNCKVDTAIKNLKEANLISVKLDCRNGKPPRNYYTVNFDKVSNIIANEQEC